MQTEAMTEYLCMYCGQPTPKAKRSACCGDAICTTEEWTGGSMRTEKSRRQAAEAQQAWDRFKAEILRYGFAPIYRFIRMPRIAQQMLARADELDPPGREEP